MKPPLMARAAASIFDIPELRQLLEELRRRRYTPAQLDNISRLWRHDVDRLLRRPTARRMRRVPR